MGAGHFRRNAGRPGFIENELLTALVQPYLIVPGSNMVGGYDDIDARFAQLPAPSLVELKGSWLGNLPIQNSRGAPSTWEQTADAFLYLGPRDTITVTVDRRSELDGTTYGKELERRLAIEFDNPPDFLSAADERTEHPAFSASPANGNGPMRSMPAIPKPQP